MLMLKPDNDDDAGKTMRRRDSSTQPVSQMMLMACSSKQYYGSSILLQHFLPGVSGCGRAQQTCRALMVQGRRAKDEDDYMGGWRLLTKRIAVAIVLLQQLKLSLPLFPPPPTVALQGGSSRSVCSAPGAELYWTIIKAVSNGWTQMWRGIC
jgi:hypothetical protein